MLRRLAAGLTDQAIGRKLEISDRTVRRLVADLTAARSYVSSKSSSSRPGVFRSKRRMTKRKAV
ncbi:hypothetical protein [Kitasatospora sp. NPDC059673]|uniref:hypothetical protein n=1 Tax=Kitasatospora sp. NPDC059673 TaxID=3346901 RepID=UPI0036B7971F